MRTKVIIIVAALVLGGLAAVLAARYIMSARSTIEAESEPVAVLVATEDIPRGMSAEELLGKGMIKLEKVPARFVASGAVSSERALEGRVLADPMTAGEQVTQSRFELPSTAGLAYSIPGEFIGLSIPVDEVKGISGLVKPGDHVALYVTFDADQNQNMPAITKMLLKDAKVLAVGAALSAEPTTGDTGGESGGVLATSRSDSSQQQTLNSQTLTLAVSATDAERIVFSEEIGKVWCALLPATGTEVPVTPGRTLETIFK